MPTGKTKGLTTAVTPRLLRRVAGERFFKRGEAYFAESAVRSLRGDGGGVKAMVLARISHEIWVHRGSESGIILL